MTLAIIDGDVLCYQACESRWQTKAPKIDGVFARMIDEHGKHIPLEFTAEENKIYLEQTWENFKRKLNTVLDETFCDHFIMAVKGPDNFRNLLYPEYKLNRHADPTKRNEFVPVIRKLAVAEDLAIESIGREADDLMRMWAEQARAAGDDYIIVTIDKDLQCIPGRHYLLHNKLKPEERIVEVSELQAERFFYEQLLKGDQTDNIPGIPKVGPVKAKAMLAPHNTVEAFQEEVVGQYLAHYGDNWESYLLSNGKMLYLQKHEDDYFRIDDWAIVKELR